MLLRRSEHGEGRRGTPKMPPRNGVARDKGSTMHTEKVAVYPASAASAAVASAHNRLMAYCKGQVEAFLDRCLELADERGFEPPKHRPRTPSEHLRWLVRYQVVGQDFTEIAADDPEHKGRKAVSNVVKQAAALIGLAPLREPSKGAREP